MFGLFENNFRKNLLYIYFFFGFVIDCEILFSGHHKTLRIAREMHAQRPALP